MGARAAAPRKTERACSESVGGGVREEQVERWGEVGAKVEGGWMGAALFKRGWGVSN